MFCPDRRSDLRADTSGHEMGPKQRETSMADGPKDFRDPKVTPGTKASGGIGKWIAIAIAAIVLLLLLGWLFGLFASDDVDAVVVPAEDGAVVVTE